MWTTLLLVIHVLLAMALVALILFQKSEGGALGIGGGPTGLLTARGATNFLTRGTAIVATLFIATSLALAVMARVNREQATAADEHLDAPAAPAAPATPQVPAADAATLPTPSGSPSGQATPATPASENPPSGAAAPAGSIPGLPGLPSVPAAQ